MKIALVSLNQFWENKEKNKIRIDNFINQSKTDLVDLIIFPEMTLTGFSMNVNTTSEEFHNSESISYFSEQAKYAKINLIFGITIKAKEDFKAYNQAVFIDSAGVVQAIYSKIHPFSYAGETKYFNHGETTTIVTLDSHNLGLTICYDLRFPELYQSLSKSSEIIINIANWPAKRIDHWNTLLMARAIENQVFMVGVNRIGTDGNDIEYEKSSKIINPEGKEVRPIYSSAEYDLFLIEPDKVNFVRSNFPIKQDRRIKLYKEIL